MHKIYDKVANISYIKPLLQVAKLLAISPLTLTPKKRKRKTPAVVFLSCNQCYAVVLCVFITTFCALLQNHKLKQLDYYKDQIVMTTDIMKTVSLLLTNLTSILSINFWNTYNYKKFLDIFQRVDVYLENYDVLFERRTSINCLELILAQCCFICLVIYDCCIWNSLPESSLANFYPWLIDYFQSCHLYIVFLMMYNFIRSFHARFRSVNSLIEKHVRQSLNTELATKAKSKGIFVPSSSHFSNVNKLYTSLCDNVWLFNSIFGWNILLFAVYILTNMLWLINQVISYTNNNFKILDSTNGVHFIIVGILWTTFTFILGVVLAKSADGVVKEVKDTATICYKLSQELQVCGKSNDELRENLLLLARHADANCPRFSAAGFLTVDYSMLFTLFNMLTSYVIVCIQLNK